MRIQCPTCARVYEWDIEVFPAKVRCEDCNAKSLISENGAVELLEPGVVRRESPAPIVAAPVRQVPHAARSIVVAAPRRGGPSFSVVIGTGLAALAVAFFLVPSLRKAAFEAFSRKPQVTGETKPDETSVVKPDPVVPSVVEPPVVPRDNPPPVVVKPAEPVPEVPQPPQATTLEEAAPEIFRVLQSTLVKMDAASDKREETAKSFLAGLFARTDGKSRADDLSKQHPALLLGLLGDVWANIEDAADAKLPAVVKIEIRRQDGNKSFDLTENYVKLLSPPSAGKPAGKEELETISRAEDIGKLFQHFTGAPDPGTPANALALGRMVYDFRKGRIPLSAVPNVLDGVNPDSLPDVKSSVNLAGFKHARELVKWAHDFNPTRKKKTKIPPGSEAETILARAKAYLALPANVLLPHPGAEEFPGRVPDKAARVEKKIDINLNLPRWQATGLYAPPGAVIEVAVPLKLRKAGAKLRIGADTDNILKTGGKKDNNLTRFPVISREVALDDGRISTDNPFGGAIYVDVPFGENGGKFQVNAHGWTIREYDKIPPPDMVPISISGAVEMPWWRPGMSASQWADELKKPAPWAEMNFGMLATCVPAAKAAEVKDPTDLAEYWNKVMDAQWKFGGYTGFRHVPMRISFDVQISAGFMHSGYPIMAHLPEAADMLDLRGLREKGNWGFFHEIGHNHQPVCITPKGFTESTVNFFTLATMKAVIPGKDPLSGHSSLSDIDGLLAKRREGETDAWTNLAVFVPLMKEFGYDCVTKVMAGIWEDNRRTGRAPDISAKEREDMLVLRFGEVVQRDVGGYFEGLGFHVTSATRKKLTKYQEWKD